MDKSKFREIQEKFKLLINHTKKEDLARGIDITKPEYKQALLLLEEKILEKLGLTRQEYESLKLSFKKPEKKISYNELIDIPTPVETLTTEAIRGLVDDLRKEIPAPTTTIVNKIVKETVKEKPQIIQTKEVIKEIDNTKVESLFQDVRTMQFDLQNLIDQVGKDITVSKQFMAGFDGEVTNKIKDLVSPEINKVVRSLQSQIYTIGKKIEKINLIETDPLSLHLDQTTPQTTIGTFNFPDLRLTLPGTVNRNVTTNLITSVVKTGGRTLTPTRDANGFITSLTDGTKTWTFTRNANNFISSWSIA